MKTPLLFECWRIRRAVSSCIDDHVPLAEPARHHLWNCAKCRRLYEVEKGIVQQLSSSSGAGRITAPPFLRARIMFEIRGAPPGARSRLLRPRWGRAAAAFSFCMLAVLLFWRGGPPVPALRRAPRAAAQPGLAELSEALKKFPDQKQVSQWIGQIDGSLENEMQLVVDDAKTAYDSLANGFLPGNGPR